MSTYGTTSYKGGFALTRNGDVVTPSTALGDQEKLLGTLAKLLDGGPAGWGNVTGQLRDQLDLQREIDVVAAAVPSTRQAMPSGGVQFLWSQTHGNGQAAAVVFVDLEACGASAGLLAGTDYLMRWRQKSADWEDQWHVSTIRFVANPAPVNPDTWGSGTTLTPVCVIVDARLDGHNLQVKRQWLRLPANQIGPAPSWETLVMPRADFPLWVPRFTVRHYEGLEEVLWNFNLQITDLLNTGWNTGSLLANLSTESSVTGWSYKKIGTYALRELY
jgi:hypothetical protein